MELNHIDDGYFIYDLIKYAAYKNGKDHYQIMKSVRDVDGEQDNNAVHFQSLILQSINMYNLLVDFVNKRPDVLISDLRKNAKDILKKIGYEKDET